MKLIPVKGMEGYFRDPVSNAIVNKNNLEYQAYIASREKKKTETERINYLQDKVDSLSSDIGGDEDMLLHKVHVI